MAGAVWIALTRSRSIAGSRASGENPSVSTNFAPVSSQPPQAWYPGPPDIGTKPPMTSSPVTPIRAVTPLAHRISCCSGRSTSLGIPVLPLVTTSLVTSCGPYRRSSPGNAPPFPAPCSETEMQSAVPSGGSTTTTFIAGWRRRISRAIATMSLSRNLPATTIAPGSSRSTTASSSAPRQTAGT